MDETPRPMRWLRVLGEQYPGVWRILDDMRAHRGSTLPWWPEWCYLPLAGSMALATGGAPVADLQRQTFAQQRVWAAGASRLAALVAWRRTKGVYRFDPALLRALRDTPMQGDLPTECLQRLPEWCIYIDLRGAGMGVPGDAAVPLLGAFAHLEWDVAQEHAELRLLFDAEDELRVVALDLGGSILDGLRSVTATARSMMPDLPSPAPWREDDIARAIGETVALVLYLCAEDADVRGEGRPGPLPPLQTRSGPREQSAQSVRVWEVGARVGAVLRHSAEETRPDQRGDGHHASPRPHVRRAHWHHYWIGSRAGDRRLVLRWLHPVLVGAADDPDALPTTIHPVL